MGRNKKERVITNAPQFSGYIPVGLTHVNVESVTFLYEEYEAVKLVDYESLNFEEAAKCMNVSKSTFGRIISSARKKVATAFVEHRPLRAAVEDLVNIENFRYCVKCYHSFLEKEGNQTCPKCKNAETIVILKSDY